MPQFLTLLSAIIILGSLSYYAYTLTNGVILAILAIILALIILLMRRSGGLLLSGLGARAGMVSDGHRTSEGGSLSSHAGAARKAKGQSPERLNWKILAFITAVAAAFFILFTNRTTEALRSSWEVVPPYFFLFYGATVFITIAGLLPLRQAQGRNDSKRGVTRGGGPPSNPSRSDAPVGPMRSDGGAAGQDPEPWAERSVIKIIPLILTTFLTLSISLIIFPLGSGFDSFIHQAAEKVIAAEGIITPKSPYYIGQYVLVVFLAKLFGLSVVTIDKLLVPLLAAILLPWSITKWWRGRESASAAADPSKAASLTIISFLLLPFLLAPFTTTTPYSLALLFLLVLIFFTIGERTGMAVAVLLALATLLIHPLVGIPAFVFLVVKKLKKNTNYQLRITSYAILSLAIPAAFLLASQFSSQINITFAPQNFLPWLSSLEWSGIYRENRFNAPLDLLYFYGFNIKNIFWFFVLTALFLSWRRGRHGDAREASERTGTPAGRDAMWNLQAKRPDGGLGKPPMAIGGRAMSGRSVAGPAPSTYLTAFLILLTSSILMSAFMSFDFLIGYEQAGYAKRVLDIAHLFLLPLFLLGVHWWLSRIPRFATIAFLTLGITASLFLTYPQKVDSYAVSHAFNTSQDDIDAVRWIEADAKGEDYIVLANQAVSAAAIREFGFKRYYQLTTDNLSRSDRGSSTESGQLTTPIFFYPVPTSSPLYKFYLKMVYKNASSETMQEAMRLVGVNRAYFVLNSYWANFDRIFTEAQENLRLLHSTSNSIFIFTLKN